MTFTFKARPKEGDHPQLFYSLPHAQHKCHGRHSNTCWINAHMPVNRSWSWAPGSVWSHTLGPEHTPRDHHTSTSNYTWHPGPASAGASLSLPPLCVQMGKQSWQVRQRPASLHIAHHGQMNQPGNVPHMSTLSSKAFNSFPPPRKIRWNSSVWHLGLPTHQPPSLFNQAPTHSSPACKKPPLQPRPTIFTPSLTPLSPLLPDRQCRWLLAAPFQFPPRLVLWAPIYPSPSPVVSLQSRTSAFTQMVD